MTDIFKNFFDIYTLIHFIMGILISFISLKIIKKFCNNYQNKKFMILFIISFSMFWAVMWEFGEFTCDFFFLTDNQRDKVIYNFSSVKLNRERPNSIENIDHTILFDKYNNQLVRFNGYLDIGIIDTMIDLFVYFVGTLFFCLIYYLKNRKRITI